MKSQREDKEIAHNNYALYLKHKNLNMRLLESLKELQQACVDAAIRSGAVWPDNPRAQALYDKCRAAIAAAEGG